MTADDDADIEELRRRLQEAEDTIRAIREGDVDALVVEGPGGDQVYTLRSAEQPYRILVEQMQEGAVILTPHGDMLYCNRRFAELMRVPLERVIGTPLDRFVPDDERPSLDAMLREGQGRHEGHLRAADGTRISVHLSLNTLPMEGAPALSLVVMDLSDLVATRRAHADAEGARQKAEAATRTRDEFLAMLGHELRNPLGAIASAVQLLDRVGKQEGVATVARDVIARQTNHLARLVDDLLDVARATTGKISLDRRPHDLAALVERSVAALRAADSAQRHVLVVDVQSVWVDGDGTRIEQVVANLLTNAVKYTPAGGTIRVTVRPDDDQAVLEVADTGIGISGDLLPRIFDLFVQGDGGLDRTPGGLGIGLTLVHRLVAMHGGHVAAESRGPGTGSTFVVRLPRTVASVAPPAPTTVPSTVTRVRRVLLVDDNRDIRDMLRSILELDGHTVFEAEDGPSAVEIAVRTHPDVALIDIGLPGFDGYEVARRLRAAPECHGLILIALTGYGRPEDRKRTRDAGFDRHLLKPVDPDALASAVASSGAPATS